MVTVKRIPLPLPITPIKSAIIVNIPIHKPPTNAAG